MTTKAAEVGIVRLDPKGRRPIYQQIQEHFVEKLRSRALAPHSLLPTAVDLAETLSISHLTVREAYKRLAQDGYVYSIRGKGTFAADRGVEDALGLTVPSEFFRSPGNSGVYAAIADTLYHLTRESGRVLKLIILTTPYRQQVRGELNAHDIAAIRDTPMRGLFISGHRLPRAITDELRKRNVRLVGFAEETDNSVLEDQDARFNLPLAYARSRGRKNVGLMYLDLGDHPSLKDRLLRAMAEAGFDPDPSRVVGVTSASMVSGQVAAEYLLNTQRKLDALICYDDLLAHGMCMACSRRRIDVPGQVLLISHANKDITPPFLLPVARAAIDIKGMIRIGYEKMCQLLENQSCRGLPDTVQPMLVPEHAFAANAEPMDVVLNVG